MGKKHNHPPSSTVAWSNRLQQVIVYTYVLLVSLTPLFFSFNTDELFEFNKMILVYGLSIIIFGLWLARMIIERKLLASWHWFHLFVALFLVSQIISAVFSIHPYTSWLGYYSRFHGGVVSFLAYSVLYLIAYSTLTKKNWVLLLLSGLVASLSVGAYAIMEHFGHSVSCALSTGTFNASCWVQDVQNRVFATFGQPNWLAAYAVMLIPLATWLSGWSRASFLIRAVGISSATILTWTLLYTKSRSGFFGFLLAMGIFVLGWVITIWWTKQQGESAISSKKENHGSEKKRAVPTALWHSTWVRWTGLALASMAIAILISGSELAPGLSSLWQHNATPPANTASRNLEQAPVDRLVIGGTDSGEIRKIVWQGAIDVWRRYPLLGSGPETFGYSYYLDRPLAHNLVSEWDFLYNKAHNEFLNFLATTGIVGLSSYVALLLAGATVCVWAFVSSLRVRQPSLALLYSALLGSAAGLAVSNLFGFSTVMVTVLQFLFWAVAISVWPRTESALEPEKTNTHRQSIHGAAITWWQVLLITLLGFFLSVVLLRLLDYYRADIAYAQSKGLYQAGKLSQAVESINTAIALSGREALYWDQLAQILAQAAVNTATEQPAVQTQLATAAIQASDYALAANPEQRNLYKSRARVFIILGQLNPQYYQQAIDSLSAGAILSPTDAKLIYNRSLLLLEQGKTQEAIADLEKAVTLKPNYEPALFQLAQLSAQAGYFAQAISWAEQIALYNPLNTSAESMIASYSAMQVWENPAQ